MHYSITLFCTPVTEAVNRSAAQGRQKLNQLQEESTSKRAADLAGLQKRIQELESDKGFKEQEVCASHESMLTSRTC